VTLAYTRHKRGTHDLWSRASSSNVSLEAAADVATREGTIAAVNLHLAARARYFVTLVSSAWTSLVAAVMGSGEGSADAIAFLCCSCGPRDHYGPRLVRGNASALGPPLHAKANLVVLWRAAIPGATIERAAAIHEPRHEHGRVTRAVPDAASMRRLAHASATSLGAVKGCTLTCPVPQSDRQLGCSLRGTSGDAPRGGRV
jgi:hypothetical protein